MEQRNERLRGPKSSGADGGDLLLSQAQLWIDLGAALASVLRRMRRSSGSEEAAGGVTADGEVGQDGPPDQEAA